MTDSQFSDEFQWWVKTISGVLRPLMRDQFKGHPELMFGSRFNDDTEVVRALIHNECDNQLADAKEFERTHSPLKNRVFFKECIWDALKLCAERDHWYTHVKEFE